MSLPTTAKSLRNKQRSMVEAVAIRDGKFLAVGTDREMMAWRGDQTQLINLNKRTAIPGDREDRCRHRPNWAALRGQRLRAVNQWGETVRRKTSTVNYGLRFQQCDALPIQRRRFLCSKVAGGNFDPTYPTGKFIRFPMIDS
jgi:hypothetical protein